MPGYPIALAVGAAMSAAGTGAQIAASEQSKSAMNDKVSAELARQRRYEAEQDATFQRSLKAQSPDASQETLARAAASRQAAYQQMEGRDLAGYDTPVERGVTKEVKAGNQETVKREQGTRANVTALSDWQLQQAIKNLRAQQALAMMSGFSRDSSGVLQSELYDASQAGSDLAGVGSLLGSAGALVGAAGAAGMGPKFGGGGATPAPTYAKAPFGI